MHPMQAKVAEPQFSFLRGLLKRRTGVCIDASKQYLVTARLQPIVRQRRLPGIENLLDLVKQGGDATLERDVLCAMMTHETSFFRDQAPFDALRRILTDLAARASASMPFLIFSARPSDRDASSTSPSAIFLMRFFDWPSVTNLRSWTSFLASRQTPCGSAVKFIPAESSLSLPASLIIGETSHALHSIVRILLPPSITETIKGFSNAALPPTTPRGIGFTSAPFNMNAPRFVARLWAALAAVLIDALLR